MWRMKNNDFEDSDAGTSISRNSLFQSARIESGPISFLLKVAHLEKLLKSERRRHVISEEIETSRADHANIALALAKDLREHEGLNALVTGALFHISLQVTNTVIPADDKPNPPSEMKWKLHFVWYSTSRGRLMWCAARNAMMHTQVSVPRTHIVSLTQRTVKAIFRDGGVSNNGGYDAVVLLAGPKAGASDALPHGGAVYFATPPNIGNGRTTREWAVAFAEAAKHAGRKTI